MTLPGNTGWREVEVGRAAPRPNFPVVARKTWILFGCIAGSQLLRRRSKGNKIVDIEQLSDKHVACLVK
ncbi:hypothetical protein [Pararhizobium sp. PWRC1-1]|uniref:hypothetical protein n=1 Tax=Pararhizobium sp. PWRC1-1 TaxID=2804566 RepID=UPI003CEE3F55